MRTVIPEEIHPDYEFWHHTDELPVAITTPPAQDEPDGCYRTIGAVVYLLLVVAGVWLHHLVSAL